MPGRAAGEAGKLFEARRAPNTEPGPHVAHLDATPETRNRIAARLASLQYAVGTAAADDPADSEYILPYRETVETGDRIRWQTHPAAGVPDLDRERLPALECTDMAVEPAAGHPRADRPGQAAQRSLLGR